MKVIAEFVTVPRDGETENGDAALVRRFTVAPRAAQGGGPHPGLRPDKPGYAPGPMPAGSAPIDGDASEGVLIAVIDALGHGGPAAQAAAVGTRYLREVRVDGGLRPIIEGLHVELRGTRGAAAMLLLMQGMKIEGCGVGNVAVRAYRASLPAMLTPGVLGGSLRRLRLFHAALTPGERLVVHSDGISSRFDDEASRRAPAIETCRAIMERYRRPHDDATVLVTDIEAS